MGYDNTQIARKFVEEILSKGNYDVVDEIVAKDIVVRDNMAPEGRGQEHLKSQVRGYRTAFPDLVFSIEDVLQTTGDRVIVQWKARGTHRGPLFGIPPTNRTAMTTGVEILRIANGKIVEGTSIWNAYSVLQQLGVVPALDALGKGMDKGAGARPQPR